MLRSVFSGAVIGAESPQHKSARIGTAPSLTDKDTVKRVAKTPLFDVANIIGSSIMQTLALCHNSIGHLPLDIGAVCADTGWGIGDMKIKWSGLR
ncbi:MAG: hypothetical protein CL580_06565 [Alteromonadaceae bacterium]|nr:hypothetical protein [Alteromonadaceae bacterium]